MLDGLEELVDGDLMAVELVRLVALQEEREVSAQAPGGSGSYLSPLSTITGLCRNTNHFHRPFSALSAIAEAKLLPEIIGNPFRQPVIDPVWLAVNDGAVRNLAAHLASSREFGEMGFLSDALEEAGCTDADLLAHLRSPDPHVRGCWALDLVLDKK